MKVTELIYSHSQPPTYFINHQVASAGFLDLFPSVPHVPRLCCHFLACVTATLLNPFCFCGLLTKLLRVAVLIWGQWPEGPVISKAWFLTEQLIWVLCSMLQRLRCLLNRVLLLQYLIWSSLLKRSRYLQHSCTSATQTLSTESVNY